MQANARRAAPAAFAIAMFLSAALIFALQPMFSRMTTPLLGGSPSVWNTSMVFFQAALLAGYLYAHLLQRVHDIRIQAGVHAAVLIAAFFVLPVQVSTLLGAPDPERPIWWLLGTLTVSIGAPFAAASATSPLLQAWYARTGRADAHDPYYLYAASNLGSLLGLLLYPVLVEPLLGTHDQSVAWTNSYLVAIGVIILCGIVAVIANGGAEADAAPAHATQSAGPHAEEGWFFGLHGVWRERIYWLFAAALPSAALLGVTQHISTDVASAPFLWVVPLALYLVAFIVAFLRGAERMTPLVLLLHPLALVLLAMTFYSNTNWALGLFVHLLVFFLSALICILALARTRPGPERLTEFYLWISIGGVVGGALTALVAPVVFNGIYEYPLALAAIALFRPRGQTLLPKFSSMLAVAAFATVLIMAVLIFRRATETVLFGGGLGAAAALMAAALPQDDGRPVAQRIGFMVTALIFAGLMTYITISLDSFRVLTEGAPRIMLGWWRYPVGAAAFLTFAFAFHQALTPDPKPQPYATIALGVAIPLSLLVLVLCVFDVRPRTDIAFGGVLFVISMAFTALAIFTNRNRPQILAGIVLAMFAIVFLNDARGAQLVEQRRSFFGVLKVEEYSDGNPEHPALRVLMHGTTIHGAQLVGLPGASRRPLTYYNPQSSLGQATVVGLASAGEGGAHAALIGLGTGTTACLLRPSDTLTIFEIDPTVVEMSGPQGTTFSYVRECQPNAEIELGDARLRMAAQPADSFDVIVVDAFSSDAIPAHLLTREAVAMYMQRLRPRGLLVLHLSNRNLALVSEAARVAGSLNLPFAWRVSDRVNDDLAGPFGGLPASTMVIAHSQEALNPLRQLSADWGEVPVRSGRPWTDDYINLPRALYDSWSGIN